MAPSMKPPAYAAEFLIAAGWEGAEILPLAGDASFRRYFRVVHGDRSAVLMDAPPPHEDPRPFIDVAEWLVAKGLTAPEILARDLERGLLLLGDFGNDVDRLRHVEAFARNPNGSVDNRHLPFRKLNVDRGARDLYDFAFG